MAWPGTRLPLRNLFTANTAGKLGLLPPGGYGVDVRWGLSLSLGGELADPNAVADVAAAAESAGWDGVFVWDHLWHRDGSPFADPFVTLSAIAVATTRVRIGPLVTPLPRRRPAIVAQQASSVDRLSGGRLTLGLGLGHDRYGEYSAVGEALGNDDMARADMLDAGLEFLLPALGGEPVPTAGNRRTTVACAQRPRCPIWVAGSAGRVAGPRRAGRHALEGVAIVGGGEWRPQHVAEARAAASVHGLDELEVVLVGGTHDEHGTLEVAGATWLIPEVLPGTTVAVATARASAGPPA
ncbi:MAG: LLM class flavin-dependent oxidoreductase [Actinomycetota bacterium]|nr:LLM class flavin-dependent oxidoreductase [Actinomycetota bacterium]